MKTNFKVGEMYITRDGGRSVILKVDRPGKYPVMAKVDGGLAHMYDSDGFTLPGQELDVDLITKIKND